MMKKLLKTGLNFFLLLIFVIGFSSCSIMNKKKPSIEDIERLQENEKNQEQKEIEEKLRLLERKIEIFNQIEPSKRIIYLRLYVSSEFNQDLTYSKGTIVEVPLFVFERNIRRLNDEAIQYLLEQEKKKKLQEAKKPLKEQAAEAETEQKRPRISEGATIIESGKTQIIMK